MFTAPGYSNTRVSTSGETGCPPQPPLEVQWNTSAYPTQAGQGVLGFLGFLNATYGYRTFDLVGYSYGGVVARATVAALKKQPDAASMAPAFSYARAAVGAGVSIPSIITMNSPHFGSPTYDVAFDPATFMQPVVMGWGQQFAEGGAGLRGRAQGHEEGPSHRRHRARVQPADAAVPVVVPHPAGRCVHPGGPVAQGRGAQDVPHHPLRL